MNFKIAVSGKGGTGKTTVAALIIRYLLQKKLVPILVVDADPNSNLGSAIGFSYKNTVGQVLEEFQESKLNLPAGMPKETFLDYKLNEILQEGKGIDFLVMGKGEGPGCYCYPNAVLKDYIEKLTTNYKYIVIDNEAGMEHISRRTSGDLDTLLLISDETVKGVRTCGRLRDLVNSLKLKVKDIYLVMNRVKNEDNKLKEEIEKQNLNLIQTVIEDELIRQYDLKDLPLVNLPDEAKSVKAINQMMEKILLA